jgi:prepilin-type N-terminal cleavage/methylation domain-containing protein
MTPRARGFTLVESLVALLVLSAGLLVAAAMLVGSMRTYADALRRVAAVNLLRDVAERLRANPGGVDDTDRAHFISAARRIAPGGAATIRYEPATGPATPERFVIALDVGRTPSEPDVLTLVLARAPVAGGA